MPPGSSLQETNRVLGHVEAILRATPEVESTSRRTGLRARPGGRDRAEHRRHRGQAQGQAQPRRRRGHQRRAREGHGVGAGARRRIHPGAAGHDWRPDRRARAGRRQAVLAGCGSAEHLGAAGGRRAREGQRSAARRRSSTSRTASRTRRAVRPCMFTVNPQSADAGRVHAPRISARSPWRWSKGEPAAAPVIVNERPYTLRVRFPASARASLEAMSNTMLVNSSGGTATLGSLATVDELPGPDRSSPRESSAPGRSDGAPRRRRHGHRRRGRAEGRRRSEAAAVDPRRVRRHLPGAAEIVPRSRRRARAGDRADLSRAAVRIPIVHARPSRSCRRRFSRPPASSSRCSSRGRRSTCRRSWA